MRKSILSDYYLERFALGELPEEEAREIRTLVSADPAVSEALRRIETSNRDFLTLHPAAEFKARLASALASAPDAVPPAGPFEVPSGSTRNETKDANVPETSAQGIRIFSKKKWIFAFPVLAAAALLLLLVLPGLKKTPAGISLPGDENALIKGPEGLDLSRTQLLVFRRGEKAVETLAGGDEAEPGDLLQLAYVAAGESYGMILSIDGRGNVTLHHPSSTAGPTALERHKKIFLDSAFELDNAPRFERFFLVTSAKSFDPVIVLERARLLAQKADRVEKDPLDLPEGLNQQSVLIRKGESR